jgi:hypothetical protein
MIEISTKWSGKSVTDRQTTYNDTIQNSGAFVDSLSGRFDYRFDEYRQTLNYHLISTKTDLSIGIEVVTSSLLPNVSNTNYKPNTQTRLIPLLTFNHSFTQTQSLSVQYTGLNEAPASYQLQPRADFSNPQNPIYGNPFLLPTFRHALQFGYNNYLVNQKMNFALSGVCVWVVNPVVTNLITQQQQDGTSTYSTKYANFGEISNQTFSYNFAKQLNGRTINLELNGSVGIRNNVSLSNGAAGKLTEYHFSERFGPRFTPSENWEINPYLSYNLVRAFNDLPGSLASNIKKLSLNLDGRIIVHHFTLLKYDVSKNFISGIATSFQKAPLVLNLALEQNVSQKRNGTLSLQIFDLFNQNNYVNRLISPTGFLDTHTNSLSRYIMLSFSISLQKWAGPPAKNGKKLNRRNDGSFIN